jgi:4-hydroxyphenylpyruvate dioxygenase
MTLSLMQSREALGELPNPLGLQGIEFIEYTTGQPEALGTQLAALGFTAVARHRSRAVALYRQGAMNIVVNAHQADREARPALAAVAFRVRDAATAYRRVLELGAWAAPTKVAVMELNIPAIHGVGTSRVYFVDRGDAPAPDLLARFSIWDVDFVPIDGADPHPPALGGLHWFGVVQYIGYDRMADWCDFYGALFGFAELPADQTFGVLTQGRILASPCGTLYWQLIEPVPDAVDLDAEELLERVAFGTPDVLATVAQWRARGVAFVESRSGVHSEERGALTRAGAGGVSIELVHDPR